MSKYRIVKRPMWPVVGLVDFMGHSDCYIIEKKGWFGWSMVPNTHHISLRECEKHLEDILADKYDGDKYIVKKYSVENK